MQIAARKLQSCATCRVCGYTRVPLCSESGSAFLRGTRLRAPKTDADLDSEHLR
jgi:hypothetical protein